MPMIGDQAASSALPTPAPSPAANPKSPTRDRTPRHPARTDPAAQQWQAFGFLEVDEDSPRPNSKGSSRLLPETSPSKGRQTPTRSGSSKMPSAWPTLEPLDRSSPSRGSARSWGGDLGGTGLPRGLHSRSGPNLSRIGTPMGDATGGFRPPSPAYHAVARWTPQASPASTRPTSRNN